MAIVGALREGEMSGSFNLLPARTVEFASECDEGAWARGGIPLLEL
jgi:hypothetical protein